MAWLPPFAKIMIRHPAWSKDRFCLTALSKLIRMSVLRSPSRLWYFTCSTSVFYTTTTECPSVPSTFSILLLPQSSIFFNYFSAYFKLSLSHTASNDSEQSIAWKLHVLKTVRPVYSIKFWNLVIWRSDHVSSWTPDKGFQFSDHPCENPKHTYSSNIK